MPQRDDSDMTGSHLNDWYNTFPLIATSKPRMSVQAIIFWTAIPLGLILWYLLS